MQAARKIRLQSLIQRELSVAIPRHVKDPRVSNITVTSVGLSSDGKSALVKVTVLGGPQGSPTDSVYRDRVSSSLEGLSSASGFLRRHLARALNLKHIPSIRFEEDRNLDHAFRIQELLGEIASRETK